MEHHQSFTQRKKSIRFACCIGKKLLSLHSKQENYKNMTAIRERTPRKVTVSMSIRRWDRLMELEKAYKLAKTIKRSMKQAESAPAMTVNEAMDFIDQL